MNPRLKQRTHGESRVPPDVAAASDTADNLVASLSSRKRLFSTIDMARDTFDGDSGKMLCAQQQGSLKGYATVQCLFGCLLLGGYIAGCFQECAL